MHLSKHTEKHMPKSIDPATPQGRAIVGAIVAWGLAWKAASMWTAAKNDSKPWFGVLFVSNTVGILDAIYIFGVSRRQRARDLQTRAEARRRAERGDLDL